MRRAMFLSAATAIGLILAGCLVGSALGLVAPGLVRGTFPLSQGDDFNPAWVGLGLGAGAGMAAGAAAVGIGLAVGLAPMLLRLKMTSGRVSQPTFAGMIVAVALLAAAFASLKNPTRVGAESWFCVTALALAASTIAALQRPIASRGFVAGFAVVGWTYLLLSLAPESRAQLPTNRLLALLEERISGGWKMGVQYLRLDTVFPARRSGLYWEPAVASRGGITGTLDIDEIQPEFRRIGHSLIALLLGFTGGVVTELGAARRHRESSPPDAPGSDDLART